MKVKEIDSKYGFEETVSILQKAVEENGLKVISIIDAQANLKRAGIEIKGNKILEVFHPKLAKEVFEKDLRAGIIPPVRIYIYEENNSVHVAVQNASDLFSQYNGLTGLAQKIDEMLNNISATISK
jgi:uncharacterized protein (DUF302 family)